MDDEAEIVCARMELIRAKKQVRVAELHTEVERLKDWREHVKAAPVTALAGSALLGFMLYKLGSAPCHSEPIAPVREQATPPKTLMSSVFSTLTFLALTAGKQLVVKQLHSYIQNSHHDQTQNRQPIGRAERPHERQQSS